MAGERSGAASTVYLVDGTYAVFRAYYAIARLSAPDGSPTNAVFGFVSTVRKLIRDHAPDHLVVAFDVAGPTHRDQVFAAYKANRAEPPADLAPQFALAVEAAQALGWPVVTAAGFEADDVLATLAAQARECGLQVRLVTSDKDLYQLVGERVTVLNPAKDNLLLDPVQVEQVFGVAPERVVDVLALMGDAVDNVPGVPSVGEKTAKALVRRYGALEAILARAETFRRLWEARERALDAIEHGDAERRDAALAELAGPARALAEMEGRLGGDGATLLAPRLAAAGALTPGAADSAVRRALIDLGQRTQPKTWLAVAEHAEQARCSRDLVTVRCDAPVTLDLKAMRLHPPDREAALQLFRRLGFRRLVEELEQDQSQQQAPPEISAGALRPLGASFEVEVLDDRARLETYVSALRERGLLAIDAETDSPNPRRGRLVGVALAVGVEGGVYVPVGHRGGEPQVPWDHTRGVLQPLLEDPRVPKIGHNAKFSRAALRTAGVLAQGFVFDTLIAAQLLDPDRTQPQRLEDLAQQRLGERLIGRADVAGRGAAARTLDLVDVPAVARDAVGDAVVAWRLVGPLREELRRADLLELFETIEMPLAPVIEEMEHAGIRVDAGQLQRMSARLEQELAALEREIHQLAGRSFNINSPQQLRTVMFDDLGLQPTGRRTQKTRVHTTGQEALEALALLHPLPAKVLEHRELSKLKGTYADALPRLIEPDGRVHTQFHQLGAATGRLSSSDPNLQNIPVRSAAGRAIRAAFVPAPGWKFLSADYSQMELRILAHLSGDPRLNEAFEHDQDVHRYTAALVAGIPLEQVTPALRAAAKAVNFGIVYGMSEHRLAREQGLAVGEARRFIAAYFARYPKVREYIEDTMRTVQRTGEARTLFGRVRRFPQLAEDAAAARLKQPAREALLRQAVNATVQGAGADIVKRAMAAVWRGIKERGLAARLLVQVHDELLFEAPPDELPLLGPLVRQTMQSAANLTAPLKVELRTADSWAGTH